ncbi:MAG: phosphatidylglycerophosphatase A [Zoogloeaceae bacterium]|jgi:phosphatidylglycerophosphatase A|nr:phosphatidylglycerophosphatase A [Zoogloeaceae bacterium]
MSRPPSVRFLFAHPAHFLALGCGSGLSPWAPGTAGTLFAWLAFVLLQPLFSPVGGLVFLALAFVGGVIVIHRTGLALHEPDHGSIVWDEIVPFWLVLSLTPHDWTWQLAAFLLFRLFDITKPQPARWFDEHLKNGLGVMLDDVIAAGYALLVLALTRFALDHWA